MYIAHKCTKCWKCDIVLGFGVPSFSCRNCGHQEDENAFWAAYRSEMYLRDLEAEIEDRYPYRDMSLIGNIIDLAVGWHVLGRDDARDQCNESILNGIKELNDKWQICYCYFGKIERRISKYEQLGTVDEKKKYQKNLDTVRDFYKDFPEKMKAMCK